MTIIPFPIGYDFQSRNLIIGLKLVLISMEYRFRVKNITIKRSTLIMAKVLFPTYNRFDCFRIRL